MSIQDGGPAFPCKALKHKPGDIGNSVSIHENSEGMTLRDYFAAKAMVALICEPQWGSSFESVVSRLCKRKVDTCDLFSVAAYLLADAMLKARQGGGE